MAPMSSGQKDLAVPAFNLSGIVECRTPDKVTMLTHPGRTVRVTGQIPIMRKSEEFQRPEIATPLSEFSCAGRCGSWI